MFGFEREIEPSAAGIDDFLERAELVPVVLRVFIPADRRSGGADALGQLGLGETGLLAQP